MLVFFQKVDQLTGYVHADVLGTAYDCRANEVKQMRSPELSFRGDSGLLLLFNVQCPSRPEGTGDFSPTCSEAECGVTDDTVRKVLKERYKMQPVIFGCSFRTYW
ncbi:hypothetical protein Barb4_01922 [Bacteroidales bacterium Barb4]|nr:hypothetical protein Barb4_01922 [Bacteroidales bacterium Barb4]